MSFTPMQTKRLAEVGRQRLDWSAYQIDAIRSAIQQGHNDKALYLVGRLDDNLSGKMSPLNLTTALRDGYRSHCLEMNDYDSECPECGGGGVHSFSGKTCSTCWAEA